MHCERRTFIYDYVVSARSLCVARCFQFLLVEDLCLSRNVRSSNTAELTSSVNAPLGLFMPSLLGYLGHSPGRASEYFLLGSGDLLPEGRRSLIYPLPYESLKQVVGSCLSEANDAQYLVCRYGPYRRKKAGFAKRYLQYSFAQIHNHRC